MYSIEFILNNFHKLKALIKLRGVDISLIESLDKLLAHDTKRKDSISESQKLEAQNNHINSKVIPVLKKEKTQASEKEILANIDIVKSNNHKIKSFLEIEKEANDKIKRILEICPNLPMYDSKFDSLLPIGGEESNLEVHKWGTPRIFDSFEPKSHEVIGISLGQMDFEQTAKISGSRFVTLYSKIARLERALINFMIDTHTKDHGYTEISVPYMVKSSSMYGTGQFPKFSQEGFIAGAGPACYHDTAHISEHDSYRLIPTSEVSLTNLMREKIISEKDLPIRMVAFSPCFRSEIGSGGRDVSGIIRLHQFIKVELVSIVTDAEFERVQGNNHITPYNKHPKEIECEHERMTRCASRILELLYLPYRTMLLSSEDTGFQSMKTYDLEVWMPSQNKYREISSCSYCSDFQGRRMNGRYKNTTTGKNHFIHTLNGSGLAVGRTLAAIIENYQTEDGDFKIPSVLERYM